MPPSLAYTSKYIFTSTTVPRNRRKEVPRERNQARARGHARDRGHAGAGDGAPSVRERGKGHRSGDLPHADRAKLLCAHAASPSGDCGNFRGQQHCRYVSGSGSAPAPLRWFST